MRNRRKQLDAHFALKTAANAIRKDCGHQLADDLEYLIRFVPRTVPLPKAPTRKRGDGE